MCNVVCERLTQRYIDIINDINVLDTISIRLQFSPLKKKEERRRRREIILKLVHKQLGFLRDIDDRHNTTV